MATDLFREPWAVMACADASMGWPEAMVKIVASVLLCALLVGVCWAAREEAPDGD